MSIAKLTLKRGYDSTVEIDGHQLESLLRGLTLQKSEHDAPVMTLDIVIPHGIEIIFDGHVIVGDVIIPDQIAEQVYRVLHARFGVTP